MTDALSETIAAWRATARYSIVRHDPFKSGRVIEYGVAWDDGRERCDVLQYAACIAVGCRQDAFNRPIYHLELEK